MAEISLKNTEEHNTSFLNENKPFKCNVCDKSFSQKGSMSTHMASIHEGKKVFKCKVCEKTFSQKSIMIRHMSSVHEGRSCLGHIFQEIKLNWCTL